MPANHPYHRPAVGWLLIVAFVLSIMAAPVSADEILYDNRFTEFTDTSGHSVETRDGGNTYPFYSLQATDITKLKDMYYITIITPYELKTTAGGSKITEGSHPFTATVSGRTFHGNYHYTKTTNIFGQVSSSRITYFFDDWDVDGLQGSLPITFSPFIYLQGLSQFRVPEGDSLLYVNQHGYNAPVNYEIYHTSGLAWENRLVVTEVPPNDYRIDIIRLINGEYSASTIKIADEFGNTAVESGLLADQTFWLRKNDANKIELTSPQTTYVIPLAGGDTAPTDDTVTVYVRNSQTGALLANANLTIQDTTTDPWTEVVNETLSSGTGTFSLPIDTGLHFTQYHIGATVPGYQQVVPALFARVTGPMNIVVEMEPTAGGPEDPNNAYLEFYVRDIHANGIPNANVLVDGKTRWTNGHGYTQFEVAKNATYPYTVSKSGYMTIQGSAIVADAPRYVANIVLGPGSVPTYTPGPGETPGGPGATPTPDTRTNEQKGQAIIDLIADFAEPIAILAILATIFGLMKMMTPGRR